MECHRLYSFQSVGWDEMRGRAWRFTFCAQSDIEIYWCSIHLKCRKLFDNSAVIDVIICVGILSSDLDFIVGVLDLEIIYQNKISESFKTSMSCIGT